MYLIFRFVNSSELNSLCVAGNLLLCLTKYLLLKRFRGGIHNTMFVTFFSFLSKIVEGVQESAVFFQTREGEVGIVYAVGMEEFCVSGNRTQGS